MNEMRQQKVDVRDGLATAIKLSFEVSDLVYYYASGNTPTGIQRVQQQIAWELLNEPSRDDLASFVIYDGHIQKWRVAPAEWLFDLITTAKSFRTGGRPWDSIYQKFEAKLATFPLRQFEAGEWLLNVGAAWSLPSYFVQVRQLRRRGVRFAIFVHDCIPVRHPSYFEWQHSVDHTFWLANVRDSADVVICNSHSTRNDYLELVKPESVSDVHVCPLDASWLEDAASVDSDVTAAEMLAELGIFDNDFVLSVGTIEPRKNHLTLVHVWDKLRQTHPTTSPNLLCVGRVGWKSDAVTSQARALGLLNNTVFFVGAVSDDILASLYKRCLLTIYVSYYEGWGLPVSESLQAGKPCIAGSNSSLIEAGADLAIHVDERSETSIHDAIAHFIDEPAALAAATDKIKEKYCARTWAELTGQILGILNSAGIVERTPANLPEFEMNAIYKFGRQKPVTRFDRPYAAEIFRIGQSWHEPEAWGNWTSKEVSELGFRIKKGAQQPTMFIGIVTAPGGASISLSLNGKHVRRTPDLNGREVIRLPLEDIVNDASMALYTPVRLKVVSSRIETGADRTNSQDLRDLGTGFSFIACFDRTSVVPRQEFLEMLVTKEI